MAKLLTNREGALLRLAIYFASTDKVSDDRNACAEAVQSHLFFEIDEDDVAEALETASGQ